MRSTHSGVQLLGRAGPEAYRSAEIRESRAGQERGTQGVGFRVHTGVLLRDFI